MRRSLFSSLMQLLEDKLEKVIAKIKKGSSQLSWKFRFTVGEKEMSDIRRKLLFVYRLNLFKRFFFLNYPHFVEFLYLKIKTLFESKIRNAHHNSECFAYRMVWWRYFGIMYNNKSYRKLFTNTYAIYNATY